MFNFGFSYIGIVYLLMMFVPNIVWMKRKPENYDAYSQKENKVLLAFERIGELLVCACVLLFSDFNIRWTYWIVWLIASFVFMFLYEMYWIRYFKSERTIRDFYGSFAGVPVAGATLPVLAFFLLGIYGSNIFLIISTVILGIGHIGIHLNHRDEVCGKKQKNKLKLSIRILKWVTASFLVVIFSFISFIIGYRNIRYFTHFKMTKNGTDEGIYIPLCGQEQYVLVRGMNNKNPVILYLHGGPSSPDSYVTYGFTDYLIENYTVVAWDERGCGRTYFRNIGNDIYNETATFEQAKEDLDALVDYICDRFGQKKVILMGHSYGTVLGSEYAIEHPDKVSAYIGVAQVVSLEKSDIYSFEDALKKATDVGDDTKEMRDAFEKYRTGKRLEDLMSLRAAISGYHPVEVSDKATLFAITSPYFGMDDFRWFLKQLGSLENYYELNRQLYDYTFGFDAYNNGLEYGMPTYFISGSCDWICPVDSVKEYANAVLSPDKDFVIIDGCGHNVQFSAPEEFAKNLILLLNN